MSELAAKKESNVVAMDNNPLKLLEVAVNNGADVDQLTKLMDLQERWEAKEAKKSFFLALAEFQSKCPAIRKKKQGHNYKYAPLADIAEQIRAALMDCGLTYRFEQKENNKLMQVTCVINHKDGHSEMTSMSGEDDDSGSKNAIQAKGSTVTYLMRYTLIGALGITTADDDIDGRLASSNGNLLNDNEVANLECLLSEVSANRAKFLSYFKVVNVSDIKQSQYAKAIQMLESKR